jgi:protein-L-isoaspartate(D-aspartate) O-methyltransferase
MTPGPFATTSTDDGDRFARARRRMVERQLRDRGISDERVLAAMAEVPRERFVPVEMAGRAYDDGALMIGEGQTISQPWIVAAMTSLLELEGDERVLEVGAGSGYGAAVLSRCCAEVVTIERHAPLVEQARAVLAELGYENVDVRHGDGRLGAPDRAPFGGILVTATAEDEPPVALFEQLAEDAALVCPVRRGGAGEHLVRFRGGVAEPVAAVRFVPLLPDTEGGGAPPGEGGGATTEGRTAPTEGGTAPTAEA